MSTMPDISSQGDWSEKWDIAGVIAGGTARTRAAWNYPNRQVIHCGQVTHPGSNAELDFFIVLSKDPIGGLTAAVQAVPVSDDNPVGTQISL